VLHEIPARPNQGGPAEGDSRPYARVSVRLVSLTVICAAQHATWRCNMRHVAVQHAPARPDSLESVYVRTAHARTLSSADCHRVVVRIGPLANEGCQGTEYSGYLGTLRGTERHECVPAVLNGTQVVVPLGDLPTKLCLAAFSVPRMNCTEGVAAVRPAGGPSVPPVLFLLSTCEYP
jgi:hypothetical protein